MTSVCGVKDYKFNFDVLFLTLEGDGGMGHYKLPLEGIRVGHHVMNTQDVNLPRCRGYIKLEIANKTSYKINTLVCFLFL